MNEIKKKCHFGDFEYCSNSNNFAIEQMAFPDFPPKSPLISFDWIHILFPSPNMLFMCAFHIPKALEEKARLRHSVICPFPVLSHVTLEVPSTSYSLKPLFEKENRSQTTPQTKH